MRIPTAIRLSPSCGELYKVITVSTCAGCKINMTFVFNLDRVVTKHFHAVTPNSYHALTVKLLVDWITRRLALQKNARQFCWDETNYALLVTPGVTSEIRMRGWERNSVETNYVAFHFAYMWLLSSRFCDNTRGTVDRFKFSLFNSVKEMKNMKCSSLQHLSHVIGWDTGTRACFWIAHVTFSPPDARNVIAEVPALIVTWVEGSFSVVRVYV